MPKINCPWLQCKYNSCKICSSDVKYGQCNKSEITLLKFTHSEYEYLDCEDFVADVDKIISKKNNEVIIININPK